MSVYFITGKLGAGKTLIAVARIREYLAKKRRVATNLDLFMEHLSESRRSKASPIRLPDKPRVEDLESIGYGCDEPDYSGKRFGLLVLDELGTWFNSRTWQDKERAKVIDWCLHARKLRWDVLFIVQNVDLIDKQLLAALGEHVVVCKRLDALPIPFIGTLLKIATLGLLRARMPKFHVGLVFYGSSTGQGTVVDRWWHRGTDLYQAYDTGQVFQSGFELVGDELVDMRAPFSYLSRWHLDGRYARPSPWLPLLRILRRVVVYGWVLVAVPVSILTGRSPARVLTAWGVCAPTVREVSYPARDYWPENARTPALMRSGAVR